MNKSHIRAVAVRFKQFDVFRRPGGGADFQSYPVFFQQLTIGFSENIVGPGGRPGGDDNLSGRSRLDELEGNDKTDEGEDNGRTED